MKYQNKKTNEVLTYPELKVRYPLVSLAPFGSPVINIILKAKSKKKDIWNGITPMVRPEYDQYTEFVKEVAPVKYIQTWEILKLSDKQITEHVIQAKEAHKLEIDYFAEGLIDEANANPYVGKKTSANLNRHAVRIRSLGKLYDEAYVTCKNDITRDIALIDYEKMVLNVLDIGFAIVDDIHSAKDIYAMDIEKSFNWPVWIQPS